MTLRDPRTGVERRAVSVRYVMLAVSLVIGQFVGSAASVEAGSGWYLLVPPRTVYDKKAPFLQGIKILTDAPLSKWIHDSSHESVADCETWRSSRILMEHSVYTRSADNYMRLLSEKGADEVLIAAQRSITESHNADVDALNAARCIASDDVRLRR